MAVVRETYLANAFDQLTGLDRTTVVTRNGVAEATPFAHHEPKFVVKVSVPAGSKETHAAQLVWGTGDNLRGVLASNEKRGFSLLAGVGLAEHEFASFVDQFQNAKMHLADCVDSDRLICVCRFAQTLRFLRLIID